MFGEYRTLSAKPGYSYTYTDGWTLSANPVYSYTYTDGWVYHGRSRYSCESVIRIILAETSLRSTVQREDALNNKIRAAKKLADIDSNSSQLRQLKQLVGETQKNTCRSSTNTLRMGVYAPCGIIEKRVHFSEEQSCLVSPGRAG